MSGAARRTARTGLTALALVLGTVGMTAGPAAAAPTVHRAPSVFSVAPVHRAPSVFSVAPVHRAPSIFSVAPVHRAPSVFSVAPVHRAPSIFSAAPAAHAGTSMLPAVPVALALALWTVALLSIRRLRPAPRP